MTEELQIWIHQCATLFALVILYYDHMLTLSAEVTFIWKPGLSLAKLLFLANRYLSFFANMALMCFSYRGFPAEICGQLSTFHQLAIIASQVIVSLVLVLRTYALYGRSRRVLFFILAVGFILLSLIAWSALNQEDVTVLIPSCIYAATSATAQRLALAWEALVLFDTMIFGLTLRQALARGSSSLRLKDVSRIMSVVLWDGSMYFALMALVNLANILSFYLAPPIFKGVLSSFANAFSVTLVSRLMLHLHQFAHSGRQPVFESGCATSYEISSASPSMSFSDEWRDDLRPRNPAYRLPPESASVA
ncbi:hypothetical protein OE88DRAFT_1738417 [Heliocybe sulcata]|uniref:DUF6533 domain-containing protein n=1 Tax=Heliocybe sulcata TaxID=5364 RepID=A0A5C3MUN4_9AGAM|nr:hypothetical protein OE88DRAFT_1738417 [Heliocybe sulcata]